MERLGKGIVAGFAATVVLSALMLMKAAMGLMPQLNVIAMLGDMLGVGAAIGWVVHFAIGAILWGVLFVWLNPYLPGGQWLKGIVFGIGAWILMMIIVMPAAGAGLFGLGIGIMAPIMTLVLHIIYGAVLGLTYGWQTDARDNAMTPQTH